MEYMSIAKFVQLFVTIMGTKKSDLKQKEVRKMSVQLYLKTQSVYSIGKRASAA